MSGQTLELVTKCRHYRQSPVTQYQAQGHQGIKCGLKQNKTNTNTQANKKTPHPGHGDQGCTWKGYLTEQTSPTSSIKHKLYLTNRRKNSTLFGHKI